MKTIFKIIILIVTIPIGLFVAVFAGATIMSLTNTGFYYTPTEEELPTQTMIEQANALPETKIFREKYPDSEPLVDRASSFGVHYQSYPDSDGPRDPNYDAQNSYVALVIPFTDDKVVGKPYIYCVQNYVRSDRIYEEDNSRFYKVQSHEDIINYLQNESCFLTKEMISKDNNEILTFDYIIESDGTTYGSQYQITSGTVNEIRYDEQSNSLIVSLNESEKGFLQILIQIGLLHSVDQTPFTYFVIVDGEEIVFEQLSPILLKIPFEKGTAQIEIIGVSEI